MADVVSERLLSLRKHLSDRLETKLSTEDVGNQCGLEKHKVYRLETGLMGNTHALVSLLRFYQSKGYNLDWILLEDNNRVPMMLSSGQDLARITDKINQLSRLLKEGYTDLTDQLRTMGFEPFDDTDLPPKESTLPEYNELLAL